MDAGEKPHGKGKYMLVNTREMLLQAQKGKYAVGAFNIENMEMAMAVISAAEALHSPVILQTTPGTLRYAPPEVFAGMVIPLAEKAAVPVALHLDHGNSIELVQRCIQAGYTSVMIDGSQLPFEENIVLTRRAVALAGTIPVEAELGTVGGKEDGMTGTQTNYTDPQQALQFMQETGASSLAVGIGTAHGIYKGKPCLQIPLVGEIAGLVAEPLVLHGTSGVAHEDVQACIAQGICKVNYATDLRQAYTGGVKKLLESKPDAFDPKVYGKCAMECIAELVSDRILMLGSKDKA